MATKANREDTIIKPSVLRQWQPKPIEKGLYSNHQFSGNGSQSNREDTIIKPSVLRQWQPKPIEKSL
jgi:hypothetical protein